MKKIIFATIILSLILITGCQEQKPKACINEKCFNIEIVNTPETRQIGLMNREYLPENEGMLFIFEKSGNYPFWMKNTLIPLDIIWINQNKKIEKIMSATPCKEEPCTIYDPEKQALYVLEINANITAEKNMKEGDTIEFKNIK
ncbi:DUF192 domain-containing protein [Candidatus Woesearchaeota archaeon]|nr:DUF192 domain-containing protein [Candidatus Woesearchaeota archaeon]MCF7901562.1 DUF192 domain-containing protein [Candidatus Woesearchaeota archaeon]MCF8013326.1 DUF192 domain-containing protein [Candidatus Woesearchaeota archaeon]